MPEIKRSLKTPKNILFVHYGENWIRGSERCLIDLIKHIDKEVFSAVLWCNSPLLAQEVKKLGVTVYLIDFTLLFGEHSPRFDFQAFKKLIKKGLSIVDEHQIALIHCNSGAPSQWLNFVSRARKLPLVLHLHSRYPLRDRITLGLYHSSMVVGVSQPVIEQLLCDGLHTQACCVIPNGIDTGTLLSQPIENIRHTLNLPHDAFVLMSVCSLIKRKGVDLLIEACRSLHEICLNVHLVVVGEGEEKERLQAQIDESHLSDFIHLIGEKKNVVGLMRKGIDLYVSGAREEVFGLTLAEAGLAQLPVIAPHVGGIPSVIEHQKTGLLVEPDNANALARAIYHLYINQEQCETMGQAGFKHVSEKLSIQTHVNEFETLYQNLLYDPMMSTRWFSHWQWLPAIKASYQFVKKTSFIAGNHKEALQ